MAIKTTTMIASIPQPILLAFIDGLELRLAEATHPARHWSMRLVPLQARAQRIVREVRLSGEGGWVNLVEIDQTDGDRSVMRVQPQP